MSLLYRHCAGSCRSFDRHEPAQVAAEHGGGTAWGGERLGGGDNFSGKMEDLGVFINDG